MTDTKTYEVTGDLTPDVAGTYDDVGEYNGKRSYELTDNGWFLWWDDVDTWYLSIERGKTTGTRWKRTDPDIEGEYYPTPPAQGYATVSEI